MGSICDRVRSQVSFELDGELSQLERAMIDRHLRRCAACAAYRVDIAGFTQALREVPAEHPEHSITIGRVRHGVGRRLQVTAAAAVALVAVGLAGQLGTSEQRLRGAFENGEQLRFPSARQLEQERTLYERARPVNAPRGARDTIR